MIEMLEKSSGNVVGVKINGRLVHEDYEQFLPKLESLIQEHGSLRWYCEMADFHGITPRAAWDEMKFDVKHRKDIERVAVVGDKASHEWMAKLSKWVFHSAEIRYFDVADADAAWEWVREGAEVPCSCGCCPEHDSNQ